LRRIPLTLTLDLVLTLLWLIADQSEEDRGSTSRIGVALGDRVVDLAALHGRGAFRDAPLIHSSECFLQVWTGTRGCMLATLNSP